MATWGHVYVTAHGEWTGAWQGETAQIGLRLAFFGPGNGASIPAPRYNSHKEEFIEGNDATFNYAINWSAMADPAGIGDQYQLNTAAQLDIATDMLAFCTSITGKQSPAFQWTHIQLSLISSESLGSPGKFVLYPASQFTMKAARAGGVNTVQYPTLPPEVACCVSWRVPVVGRRGRGRMYVPALCADSVNASGMVLASTQNLLVASGKTLADDLANLPGIDPVGVNSSIVVTSPGAATYLVPTEVRVGGHYDAQRRRQHQVPEAYVSDAL